MGTTLHWPSVKLYPSTKSIQACLLIPNLLAHITYNKVSKTQLNESYRTEEISFSYTSTWTNSESPPYITFMPSGISIG